MDGKQVKTKFPLFLYRKLQEESELTGNTMASFVRLSVKDRYFPGDEQDMVDLELMVKSQAAMEDS